MLTRSALVPALALGIGLFSPASATDPVNMCTALISGTPRLPVGPGGVVCDRIALWGLMRVVRVMLMGDAHASAA